MVVGEVCPNHWKGAKKAWFSMKQQCFWRDKKWKIPVAAEKSGKMRRKS
jgi:hypothetical protein